MTECLLYGRPGKRLWVRINKKVKELQRQGRHRLGLEEYGGGHRHWDEGLGVQPGRKEDTTGPVKFQHFNPITASRDELSSPF